MAAPLLTLLLVALGSESAAAESTLSAGANMIANEREARGGASFRGGLTSRPETDQDGRGGLLSANVIGYVDDFDSLYVTGLVGGHEWTYVGLQGGASVFFARDLQGDYAVLPELSVWGRAWDRARVGVGFGRMLDFGIPMPLVYGGVDVFARGFRVRLCGGYLPGRVSDQAAGTGLEVTLPLGEVFAVSLTGDAVFQDVAYRYKPLWGAAAVAQATF